MRKSKKLGYKTGWNSVIRNAEIALKKSRPAQRWLTTTIDDAKVKFRTEYHALGKTIYWSADARDVEIVVFGWVDHYSELKAQVRKFIANRRAYEAAKAAEAIEKEAARQARVAKHEAKMKRRAAVAKARKAAGVAA